MTTRRTFVQIAAALLAGTSFSRPSDAAPTFSDLTPDSLAGSLTTDEQTGTINWIVTTAPAEVDFNPFTGEWTVDGEVVASGTGNTITGLRADKQYFVRGFVDWSPTSQDGEKG